MACLGLECPGVIPSGSRPLYAAVNATAKPLRWFWRDLFWRDYFGLGVAREGDRSGREPVPRGYRKRSEIMTIERREGSTDRTCAFRADSNACMSGPRRCRMHCVFWVFLEAPLPDWVRECAVANRAPGVEPGVKP